MGTLASPSFQPWLLLEGPSPSPPAALPHLSVELAQVFVQRPGEPEQGNALASKENVFEGQFFTLIGVTVCPDQQLCQLRGGDGACVDRVQQCLGVRGRRRKDYLNTACR